MTEADPAGPADAGAIDPHAVQDDTASRASATRAFYDRRRLATAIAQVFSGGMPTVRVSITLAAS